MNVVLVRVAIAEAHRRQSQECGVVDLDRVVERLRRVEGQITWGQALAD